MASSGEFQVPIDGWFMGRVKSYQPGTGYGFIECEETYRYFRRDVYLSRHQLEQLDIRTVPMGTDILFRVVVPDGKPQACDLAFPGAGKDMWSGQKGYSTSFCEDEAGQQKQGPRTDVEPTMKQCEHGLNGFKNCLQTLAMSLELHGLSDESFKALREADAALRCVQCRRDERTEGSKILLLLEQAKEKWGDKDNLCHHALRNGLAQRLSAPPVRPVEMPISRLRFTQNTHSKRFLHGPHAGKRIEWLTEQLLTGSVALDDPSMVLHVVYYHGHYRSLNNRHLTAIVKYAEEMEMRKLLPRQCRVRVWPLVRCLSMS